MSAISRPYNAMPEPVFSKGTSKRIYGELYKVIDSSDVIIHVLDARDPLGTLCQSAIDYIKKEKSHKQVVYLINKVDLVPGWVTVGVFPLSLFPFSHRTFLSSCPKFPFNHHDPTPLPSQMSVLTSERTSLRRWENNLPW